MYVYFIYLFITTATPKPRGFVFISLILTHEYLSGIFNISTFKDLAQDGHCGRKKYQGQGEFLSLLFSIIWLFVGIFLC
ncbi:hypothetical protein F5Y17DRAFT_442176, partial [Xylariaceae sp. FL0594]